MIPTINFKQISETVSVLDYAEFLGMKIDRGSKIICPFHGDKNPSMKVDQRFHCFDCGEDGNVIDFVSKYFEVSYLIDTLIECNTDEEIKEFIKNHKGEFTV